MRSGYIDLPGGNDGALRYTNASGHIWSSRGSTVRNDNITALSGYDLHFNVVNVASSFGPNDRWHGFPLRCLSTVLGHIE